METHSRQSSPGFVSEDAWKDTCVYVSTFMCSYLASTHGEFYVYILFKREYLLACLLLSRNTYISSRSLTVAEPTLRAKGLSTMGLTPRPSC